MGSLDGKVAFITGAARGMGQSHATTLAREGADIVMVDISENIGSVPYDLATADQLEQTRAEVEALGVRVIAANADVRSQEQLDAVVARAVEEFGGIDIYINLSGVWRTAKAATPSMIERGGGAIVLISSVNGLEPNADFAHYTSAKSGVIGLMMAIAFEGGPHNIRCNAICPGVVDTPMNDWQGAYDLFAGKPGGTREDRYAGAMHWSLLKGRGVLPRSAVSNAILWMVADTGEDITGLVVPIDGGHSVLPRFNPSPVRDSVPQPV
jgi:NAD(P)-dependent dehydrogenase (short-subunit alcohol dehydrogenase family)